MTGHNLRNLKIDIRKNDFDVNLEIKNLTKNNNNIGAVVSFLGIVRDIGKNDNLKFIEIEHYPDMSEKVLQNRSIEAAKRWNLQAISLIHRVGKLYSNENIVLLITAAVHRTDAFTAAEFLMDFLKSEAPFWKKEVSENGSIWVEETEADKKKLLRWK